MRVWSLVEGITRTFLYQTSHPKNGVRLTIEMQLTIEMRLTFGIFVKMTVRDAYAHTVYTKSHMRVSLDLVDGNFLSVVYNGQNWGCDL